VDGDRNLLKRVIDAFFKEYPQSLDKLRASIGEGDAAGVRHAAHQLNGSMRFFSATRVSELALRLECMGRDGELDGAVDALASLESEIQRVVPTIRVLSRQADTGEKR
jgi:HPt (histidine-containing phosphotransfer) domain-containing protein